MENFYVAATKNGRPEAVRGNVALLVGPFNTLEEAESHRDAATRYTRDNFYMQGADWWGYAVVGIQDCTIPGKLNEALGIVCFVPDGAI